MRLLELVQGKRGTETACYAVYDPGSDSWMTSVWEGVECVPIFQTHDAAAKCLSGQPGATKAVVLKVAPSDIARKVTSKPGPVCGLLLIAASGDVQRVVLRDPPRKFN